MDAIWATLIYKLVSLISGVFICFLGHRLFTLGVFATAGDFDARFKDTKVVLKRAAPGTFFALFGAAVISVTIWKGVEFQTRREVAESEPIPITVDNYVKPPTLSIEKVISALKSGTKLPDADVEQFLNYFHTLELREKANESDIIGENYNPELYEFNLRKKSS